jgi:hypothetical protein
MGNASSKAGGTRQTQVQHSHRQGKLSQGARARLGGVRISGPDEEQTEVQRNKHLPAHPSRARTLM